MMNFQQELKSVKLHFAELKSLFPQGFADFNEGDIISIGDTYAYILGVNGSEIKAIEMIVQRDGKLGNKKFYLPRKGQIRDINTEKSRIRITDGDYDLHPDFEDYINSPLPEWIGNGPIVQMPDGSWRK